MRISARIGLLMMLLFGSIHTASAQDAAAPPSAGVPAGATTAAPLSSAPAMAVDPDYRLGVADKVRIIVYNEPSLTGEFLVNANGSLSLPLIGDVRAQGRTSTEIRAEIERKLSDGYLKEPRVSMDVLNFRPYYILGEVTKPGEYQYSAGLTVMNAVATAQGFTYRANKRYAFIKSKDQTSEERKKLTPDLMVEPGDTIRIGERYF